MAGALKARNNPLALPTPTLSLSVPKKSSSESVALAPSCWQTHVEFLSVQEPLLSSPPQPGLKASIPGLKASIAGIATRARLFLLLPPRFCAPPSQQLHMPALLKASMKTAVEALSSCWGRKGGRNQKTKTLHRVAVGGADRRGLLKGE